MYSFKIWGLKAVHTYELNYNKANIYLNDIILLPGKEKYKPVVIFVIKVFYN
ncbi:unnamed protein product [marine sediment metagenome]|uniref:Uncharacterized protein n=1 Tax=marine sediment metagenome TaxID=412755 RepID=X1AU31_9ZZZZ